MAAPRIPGAIQPTPVAYPLIVRVTLTDMAARIVTVTMESGR
jgi:hypothetical protein